MYWVSLCAAFGRRDSHRGRGRGRRRDSHRGCWPSTSTLTYFFTGIPLHCYAIGSACAKTSGSRRASRNLYPFVAGVVGGTAACYIYVVVVNL